MSIPGLTTATGIPVVDTPESRKAGMAAERQERRS